MSGEASLPSISPFFTPSLFCPKGEGGQGGAERERERQTDILTETERDRDGDRDTERDRDRHRDRERQRQRENSNPISNPKTVFSKDCSSGSFRPAEQLVVDKLLPKRSGQLN